MKRTDIYKKVTIFPILLCMAGILIMYLFFIYEYRRAVFDNLSSFCETIVEEKPEFEQIILSSLKKYHTYTENEVKGNKFLYQYGYGSGEFGNNNQYKFIFLSAAVFMVTACGFIFVIRYMDRRNGLRIEQLIEYLEKANTGSAAILQTKEDEFAGLQDEIYKTVTSLYQSKEAASLAKSNYADNLANIAHQLKTSITAALLSVQLMKRETSNIYVNQIGKQLERLNKLEEALLTISKLDAGALRLECEKVDTYTVLNLAADNMHELLEEQGITIDIPDRGCAEFSGDMEWTMEALINLIKNCMEHSVSGGSIHCEYSLNPIYVEILIWDEGEGFASEDLPRLFERFYRGKATAQDGTGIGLSLAKTIIELQNGTISARNLPNGGACFEIRIYSH